MSNDLQAAGDNESYTHQSNNNFTLEPAPSSSASPPPSSASDNDDFKINLFGNVLYPFRWITLPTLYSWLGPISSAAMVIGCVMPYVPQYITIYKNRITSGFSTFVCLTLLVSNILRIAFWFGHPFELPLLIQSLLQVVCQLMLQELCIRVKNQNAGRTFKKRTLFSCNPRYFWRWTDLLSYIEFLFIMSAILGVLMYFLIDCQPFVETIGYCALVSESMLGLPQVIKNFKNKSVAGMSISMVLMWLAGDTFKTAYFIVNKVPLQFWLCGILQITIDLSILFQVCLFKQNAPIKTSSHSEQSPKEMMAL